MRTFDLETPETLADAVELLRRQPGAARPFAGGTALIPLWKQGVLSPGTLVDLSRIPELVVRAIGDGAVTLGAMVRLATLEDWRELAERAPLLHSACRATANRRIREMATVGGCLAHAEAASDLNTAALASDLSVHLRGPAGTRTVPVEHFFRGLYETAAAEDELVTHVSGPVFAPERRHAYLKFSPRSRYDKPAIVVAVAYTEARAGACAEVRIALGGVAQRPVRMPQAEQVIEGRAPTAELIEDAAAAAERAAEPLDDLRGSSAYKREMVRVFVRRALRQASGSAIA